VDREREKKGTVGRTGNRNCRKLPKVKKNGLSKRGSGRQVSEWDEGDGWETGVDDIPYQRLNGKSAGEEEGKMVMREKGRASRRGTSSWDKEGSHNAGEIRAR